MLHFYLKLGPETLVSKKLTLFCPFEFGQPYNLSFSAYVLGKQIDKGLIPNNCFKNESQANSTITETPRTMFKLPLCLGIYDEKIIQYIKLKEIKSHGNNTKNTYYVDSN